MSVITEELRHQEAEAKTTAQAAYAVMLEHHDQPGQSKRLAEVLAVLGLTQLDFDKDVAARQLEAQLVKSQVPIEQIEAARQEAYEAGERFKASEHALEAARKARDETYGDMHAANNRTNTVQSEYSDQSDRLLAVRRQNPRAFGKW